MKKNCILSENIFGKTYSSYICITVFSRVRVIWMYILIAMDYYLFIFLREISTYNLKKQKHLLGKIFDSPHISNLIYLLRNCSSNYVYLKNRYITLAGIGKIMFVSVFRILLICKSLNLQPPSLKKLNFPMLQYLHTIFRVRKLISV